MKRDDVQGRIWHVANRKTDTPLTIPLTDELVDLLRSLPRFHSEYVFAHSVSQHMSWGQDQLAPIRRAMGFAESWSAHTLRHTFATVAEEAGTPRYVVKYALGHSDGSVTGDYSHAEHHQAKLDCLALVSSVYTEGTALETEGLEDGSIWD